MRQAIGISRRAAVIGFVGSALGACARATPGFTDRNGRPAPGSIAEETWLPMPGAREYLLVRGRNIDAEAVLFLHGGPGGSETALMRLYHPALEDEFVMAYWDQRGAGRSWSADIPIETMTIAQFLQDMDQVVDHLRRRLNRDRIWLLGHSWGSALGMLYLHRNPGKVAGYIGTGQVASVPMDELHAYEFTLQEARRRNDQAALEKLRTIGPPPYTHDQLMVRDRLVDEYGGYFHVRPDQWQVAFRALTELPETDIRDLVRLWHGTAFSQRALWPEFARLDLTRQVPAVARPVTFILGRYDHRDWSVYAADYLAALSTPSKRLVWLENSAHNAPFEEPEAFRQAMIAAIKDARTHRADSSCASAISSRRSSTPEVAR
ncbi:MAG: alpha/beta fold hydrolase [Rhodopila sp.]